MYKEYRMKTFLFILGSIGLTSLVIGNAFYQKRQFYPTVVYLTKSSASLAIIYMQVFIFALSIVKLAKSVFFGQLRPSEVEHIMEKGWFALTETCLAFTLFRDEFTPKFVALFALLLVIKCFHWIGEERVDYMERSPVISLLFKIRISSLIIILTWLDTYFVHSAYYATIVKGANVQLVFGFEYAILFLLVLNINIKFILHLIDLHGSSPWENKATYLLYLELFTGFFRVTLYITFLAIMMRIHTFPLFAIRPMYLAFKSLKRAARDVVMSRRAIRNMDTLYPSPDPLLDFPQASTGTAGAPSSATGSSAELAGGSSQSHHLLCIICREEVRVEGYAACKKLPCNHIFHTSCLRGWFQRQQTCPTCRLNVLKPGPITGQAQSAARGTSPSQTRVGPGGEEGGVIGGRNQGFAPAGGFPPPPFGGPFFYPHPPAAHGLGLPAPMLPPFFYPFPPPPFPPNFLFHPPPPLPFPQYHANMPPNATTSSQPSGPTSGLKDDSGPSTSSKNDNVPAADIPNNQVPFGDVPSRLNFPPMPEPNFTALSEEELKRMEGVERDHLETRIRYLRNIQILLDSAVVQLQQYVSVVGSSSTTIPSGCLSRGEVPLTSTKESGKGDISNTTTDNTTISPAGPSTSNNLASKNKPDDLHSELRKRRIERLDKTEIN